MESTRSFAPVEKNLILNPEGKHISRMGKSIWVYLYLLLIVNYKSGRAIVKSKEISQDTGIEEHTILTYFGVLKKWNYLDIKKQKETYVITVCKWKRLRHLIKPQKGSKNSSANESSQLVKYISEILQEKGSSDQFSGTVKEYTSTAIHSCLQKAVMVPQEKIRKSRTALFLYFLKQHEKQK